MASSGKTGIAAPGDERFAFGKNWQRFLSQVSPERIADAESSLVAMLGEGTIENAAFLDAGSGSGLFSLAALRRGAARVHSFDYDPHSVASTAALRDRHPREASRWQVERGSVLDGEYLDSLGEWDVVYSWGVLHHTGNMWQAMANVDKLVAPGGLLYIALYNDQGRRSRAWARIKRTYNRFPRPLRLPFLLSVAIPRELLQLGRSTLRLRPHEYVRTWTDYRRYSRGMSRWHDIVDWIGGYPFEVARPDDVFGFYRERGYQLSALRTIGGGSGCNEYVFKKGG